ncbi:MAG: DNA-directed RNA polymerase subunit omega [Candidatus Cloacimonetes bacterium]|nr:DNA-directed RNA polymerase subunit omega [bacterium]MCO4783944.1 DNA-directed RNA polymerase subunit omega [Candidatus Cloacimonadota bacterium]
MIIFDIDKVQKELDGKFNLSHLIVNRVKKLKAGVESKVERKMREKEIILAIREIDSGELVYARDEGTTRNAQVELSDSVIIEDN